jgi:hypothetical protein
MHMREQQSISKADLLTVLGPCPSIVETAEFLREHPSIVRRKLYNRELERLPGLGVIKISIPSLLKILERRD